MDLHIFSLSCFFSLYDFRENGIRTLAGGKFYDKLKRKRLSCRDRNENLWNWRKLLPKPDSDALSFKTPVSNPSVPIRKKAAPIDILGEMNNICKCFGTNRNISFKHFQDFLATNV